MTTYRVFGTAHGSRFDEDGFATETEATEYASSIIDGDYDSDIRVVASRTDHWTHICGSECRVEQHTPDCEAGIEKCH